MIIGKHGGEELNCPEMLERLGKCLRGAIKGKMGVEGEYNDGGD